MERSKTLKAVLGLGNELVKELAVERDTLGRWICHDLAERLSAYKNAKGPARDVLAADIRARVFQFWKHRATLPEGVRPFEHYAPVLRALESLDPERTGGRYYNYDFVHPQRKNSNGKQVADWLGVARAVDRGARSLITLCLASAAQAAGVPKAKWLKAAKVLADDDDLDFKILIRIAGSKEPIAEDEPDPNAEQRAKLKRIRDHLSGMNEVSVVLMKHLDQELAQLG